MNSKRPELKPEEKKELFVICLALKEGNITEACRLVGVHRKTYYYWMEEDPEFAAQIEDLEGEDVDKSIEALKDLAFGLPLFDKNGVTYIAPPHFGALKLLLAKKAKKEGFGDSKKGEQLPTEGGLHLHWHDTPEPKNLAEWEQQVREARTLRRIEAAKDAEKEAEREEKEKEKE